MVDHKISAQFIKPDTTIAEADANTGDGGILGGRRVGFAVPHHDGIAPGAAELPHSFPQMRGIGLFDRQRVAANDHREISGDAQRFKQMPRQALDLVGANGKPHIGLAQAFQQIMNTGKEPRVVGNMAGIIIQELAKTLVEQGLARRRAGFSKSALHQKPRAAAHQMANAGFRHTLAAMQRQDDIHGFAKIRRRVGKRPIKVK